MATQTRDKYTEDEMYALVGSREFVINRSLGGFGISTAAKLYIGEQTKSWDWKDCVVRADPRLCAAVRELGTGVNGRYADLTIVRIPKALDILISEYDGNEELRGVVPWRDIAMDIRDPLDNGAARAPLTKLIRSSAIDMARLPEFFESHCVYAPADMPQRKTGVDMTERVLLSHARTNIQDLIKFHRIPNEPSHIASDRLLSLATSYVSGLQEVEVRLVRDELSKNSGHLYRKWEIHEELRVFAVAVLDRATTIKAEQPDGTHASMGASNCETVDDDMGVGITAMLIDCTDATTCAPLTDPPSKRPKRLHVDRRDT